MTVGGKVQLAMPALAVDLSWAVTKGRSSEALSPVAHIDGPHTCLLWLPLRDDCRHL